MKEKVFGGGNSSFYSLQKFLRSPSYRRSQCGSGPRSSAMHEPEGDILPRKCIPSHGGVLIEGGILRKLKFLDYPMTFLSRLYPKKGSVTWIYTSVIAPYDRHRSSRPENPHHVFASNSEQVHVVTGSVRNLTLRR